MFLSKVVLDWICLAAFIQQYNKIALKELFLLNVQPLKVSRFAVFFLSQHNKT